MMTHDVMVMYLLSACSIIESYVGADDIDTSTMNNICRQNILNNFGWNREQHLNVEYARSRMPIC